MLQILQLHRARRRDTARLTAVPQIIHPFFTIPFRIYNALMEFERRGRGKTHDAPPNVLHFPADEIRAEKKEIEPALLEQFAQEVLTRFQSDPECSKKKIENNKETFNANLTADPGDILSAAYKNRLLLNDLRLYFCTAAALYIDKREIGRRNKGPDRH